LGVLVFLGVFLVLGVLLVFVVLGVLLVLLFLGVLVILGVLLILVVFRLLVVLVVLDVLPIFGDLLERLLGRILGLRQGGPGPPPEQCGEVANGHFADLLIQVDRQVGPLLTRDERLRPLWLLRCHGCTSASE